MDNLVINDKTNRYIELMIKNPSHAYLFYGPDGLGKTTIAEKVGEALIGNEASSGDIAKWLLTIRSEEGKKISINQTKQIRDFLNRIKPKNIKYKVVIIDDAQTLSQEAANSLLLVLEEPPKDSVIILVSSNLSSMPATVLSRLQKISFGLPAMVEVENKICTDDNSKKVLQLLGPYPGKIHNYLNSPEDSYVFTLREDSQKFLDGDLAERLRIISAYTEKDKIMHFLETLYRILPRTALSYDNFVALQEAQAKLYNNVNTKLLLENFTLRISQ